MHFQHSIIHNEHPEPPEQECSLKLAALVKWELIKEQRNS